MKYYQISNKSNPVYLTDQTGTSSLASGTSGLRLACGVVREAGQHGRIRRSSGRGGWVVGRLEYGERTRIGRAIATLWRCWRGRIGGEGQGEPWGRPSSGSSIRARVNTVISAALWWTAQQTHTCYSLRTLNMLLTCEIQFHALYIIYLLLPLPCWFIFHHCVLLIIYFRNL